MGDDASGGPGRAGEDRPRAVPVRRPELFTGLVLGYCVGAALLGYVTSRLPRVSSAEGISATRGGRLGARLYAASFGLLGLSGVLVLATGLVSSRTPPGRCWESGCSGGADIHL